MANGSIYVDGGKNLVLNRAYKATPDNNEPNQIKVGIENATPSVTDTDLTKPIPISGTEEVDDNDTADWNDSADMTTTLNNTTFKEGTGALDTTKDGAASATASTSKTTTSVDFTSKDLWVWVYIKDTTAYDKLATTDALTIRFGSAVGDYYEYTRDKADLAVGWNAITFNSTTADSETGTVDDANCDYSYLSWTATGAAIVWTAGDFIMDDWKVASSGDYFKAIDSGYPTFDTANKEVELRFTVLTTDANGYDINGLGVFNDDGTPVMAEEDTFTAESKSSTDEFVFIVKNRIE